MQNQAVATTEKEIGPIEFFEIAHQTFKQAAEVVGGTDDHYICAGGQTIRVSFAGSALVPRLLPAMAHITTDPIESPTLTICLFDSASTGVFMPPPPWPPTAYGARGEIQGYNTERIYTFYQPGLDILRMIDLKRRLAIYWVDKEARVPWWESSFPFRLMIHWWSGAQPLQLMHSGAVGLPTGGVLIAGKSGSGKSTSTLTCLDSELRYVGDDYILVQTTPTPYVYSMYNTAKLEPENLDRLPNLRSLVSNPGQLDKEKAIIYLTDHYPEKLIRGFPIEAILLPRITGQRETRLTKASQMASLRALMPTTIFHLPRASQESLQKMSSLVKQVPSYHLELGTELSQIPQVILDLLNGRE